MKPTVKRLLNALFLIFTLGIVLWIGLSGNDISELKDALSTLSPVYLLLCLLCWALYLLADALSVHCFLKSQGRGIKLRQSLHAAIVGVYYSSVTPGATGGQPMEIYTLSKYRVPIGISASAMAIKFIAFEAVNIVVGLALWAFGADFVNEYASGSKWFIALGFIVKCLSLSGVVTMAISPRAVRWIISASIKIGVKLKLCKNPEHAALKWESNCQSFLSSVQLIIRHPKKVLAQLGIAFMQLMAQTVTIVVIYHAYSLSGISDMNLLTMSVLLYTAASYTPLPGASGAQEGGFALLFKGIFPQAELFVALLIWRFSTYYLSVLVGAVVTTAQSVRDFRASSKKREANPNEHIGS